MKRRKIIHSLGFTSTHILFPGILGGFIAACQRSDPRQFSKDPFFFNKEQFEFIKKVIDIILPATQSKSASDVNVQFFLDEVFDKCMEPKQQEQIRKGIDDLLGQFNQAPEQLASLIKDLDQRAYNQIGKARFFVLIKQYTLIGFFGSQEGMTVASNYNELPGEFKGEIQVDNQTLNQGRTDLRFYL